MIARPHRPDPVPVPVSLSRVLMVEGDTPMHFFEALLRHLDLADQIEVRNFGGVRDLKPALKALASTSEFRRLVESVGVVRDAEIDASGARRSVEDALAEANLPQGVGTSVFILPDNEHAGMIETLCVESVRDDDAFPCVEQFFKCLDGQGVSLPDEPQLAKSYAQAFLATRPNVRLYPGVAAYRGYWPWNSSVFDDVREFLKSL